jgi:hypothetical protein
MKKQTLILIFLCTVFACTKPPKPPTQMEMDYINLNDKEMAFGESHSLDLDKDGRLDFEFYTILIGDPIAKQDMKKYCARSRISAFLPMNEQEHLPVLNMGDPIPLENFQGYTWYGAAWAELAQKIISVNGPEIWDGEWKDSDHQYLPIQITRNNQRFNGWIELSFNKETEKLILHKAALSTKPEGEVKAGV